MTYYDQGWNDYVDGIILTSQQVNVRTPKTIKTVGKTGGIITAGAGTKKIAV